MFKPEREKEIKVISTVFSFFKPEREKTWKFAQLLFIFDPSVKRRKSSLNRFSYLTLAWKDVKVRSNVFFMFEPKHKKGKN